MQLDSPEPEVVIDALRFRSTPEQRRQLRQKYEAQRSQEIRVLMDEIYPARKQPTTSPSGKTGEVTTHALAKPKANEGVHENDNKTTCPI